ncbi:LEA type 2 family protein [Kordia sp.]|uniref:LEA type 2 family protein n=1 Tax=Kordia sp. TaxID=1965332 RepID=UPI003D2844C7
MKKLIYIPLLLLLINCDVQKKPLFVAIENIKVNKATLLSVELTAAAVFFNQNDIGGTLKSDNIKVYVDDAFIADISSEAFPVPANGNFSIPLKVVAPLNEIFENNKNGMLESILKAAQSQKITVQYKGTITYTALGFSYNYEIDQTQEVKIKL